MISEAEGRLVAILRRDLGADDVRFVRGEAPPPSSDRVIQRALPGGPVVVVSFAEPPADREARVRRMEMIVDSFADLLAGSTADTSRPRHPPPARSLAGELSALAGRADALCALVVDATSPVIWGTSDTPEGASDDPDESVGARLNHKAADEGLRFATLISQALVDTEGTPPPAPRDQAARPALSADERAEFWRRVLLVRNALGAVRALPQVAHLHKGEHLHESVRTPEVSYVVRSFATIYMLLLVFDRPFDELRAERSVAHALPIIERLVLALPPSEPTPPMAGVGVVRVRRR